MTPILHTECAPLGKFAADPSGNFRCIRCGEIFDVRDIETEIPDTWAVDETGTLVVVTDPGYALASYYDALDNDSLEDACAAVAAYSEARRLGITVRQEVLKRA